jgi:hypothetical protein
MSPNLNDSPGDRMNSHNNAREYAARSLVTETSLAFRTGPRIAPHRAAFEYYPTPPEATRALLSVESFDGPVWESACGEGHISKVLEETGHTVVSTDLATCWGYGDGGRDFLREPQALAKHIVTNPPYGKGFADQFTAHAVRLTRPTAGKVTMLIPIQSLAHPLRHAFWTSNPPAPSTRSTSANAGPTAIPSAPPRPSASSATAGWCGDRVNRRSRRSPGCGRAISGETPTTAQRGRLTTWARLSVPPLMESKHPTLTRNLGTSHSGRRAMDPQNTTPLRKPKVC